MARSLIRASSPVDILQSVLRFDTTNPPGNEDACIGAIDQMLREAGLQTVILARDPARPNLVARLPGAGNAAPLLLQGHVDVVTTQHQEWQYPPFEGVIADGYVWGRGALDMKGGVAMMLAAMLRARADGTRPPGDVILAVLSDEEAGGDYGARFLVENHPDLFKDVRYALGEFGGFSLSIGGKTFYLVQVAEKQMCWLKGTVRGPGGHGSQPNQGGTMAKLGRILTRLDRRRLPVHITPVTEQMITTMAETLSAPLGPLLRQLLDPRLTDSTVRLLGAQGQVFDAVTHNTVNVTIVRGGEKINVIPSEVELELDGRLLSGFQPDDCVEEVYRLVGRDLQLEVLRYEPGPAGADMGLFDILVDSLRADDEDAVVVPFMMPAVTDARIFAHLGIQSYGFTPMKLPPGFDFTQTIHAANERIPVDALQFGTDAIYRVLQRFG